MSNPASLSSQNAIDHSKTLSSSAAFERHYSVKELASLWGLSERTIRRIFVNEPGIIEWGQGETRSKRGYRTCEFPRALPSVLIGA